MLQNINMEGKNMKGILLTAAVLLVFLGGYVFMKRLDLRILAGRKRRQSLKESKIAMGDDPDD